MADLCPPLIIPTSPSYDSDPEYRTMHRHNLTISLPDMKPASKPVSCEGDETRSSVTRSSSADYEWANSDPPIQRPADFPTNKLFLPVEVRPRRGCLCNQVLTNAEAPSPYSAECCEVDANEDGSASPFDWEKFEIIDRFRFDGLSVCKASGQHIVIGGDTRRLINSQSECYKEETDAYRSFWDPSNYQSWRNRLTETRRRSMRSSSSLNKVKPWPNALRAPERRATTNYTYKSRAYVSWKDWLRQNASNKKGCNPSGNVRIMPNMKYSDYHM